MMTDEKIAQALGNAAAGFWFRLPHDLQHILFEEFVAAHGEEMRLELAKFLHRYHPKTADPLTKIAREIPEPDSIGG